MTTWKKIAISKARGMYWRQVMLLLMQRPPWKMLIHRQSMQKYYSNCNTVIILLIVIIHNNNNTVIIIILKFNRAHHIFVVLFVFFFLFMFHVWIGINWIPTCPKQRSGFDTTTKKWNWCNSILLILFKIFTITSQGNLSD